MLYDIVGFHVFSWWRKHLKWTTYAINDQPQLYFCKFSSFVSHLCVVLKIYYCCFTRCYPLFSPSHQDLYPFCWSTYAYRLWFFTQLLVFILSSIHTLLRRANYCKGESTKFHSTAIAKTRKNNYFIGNASPHIFRTVLYA